MAEESKKNLKVRSIYQAPNSKIPSETDAKDSTLKYGLNTLLSCFEAQKLNKSVVSSLNPTEYALIHHKSSSQATYPEIDCLAKCVFFFRVIESRKMKIEKRCKTNPIVLGRKSNLQEALHHKSFLHEKEMESDGENLSGQVPQIFDGFNIFEDQQFSTKITKMLKTWSDYVSYVEAHKEVMNSSIAFLTLRTLMVYGEYLHLHKLRSTELKVWDLACRLAAAQDQMKTYVYIVSRCLKLKRINDDWIAFCEDYIENNKELHDTEVVAIFWLELANFYFDCAKIDEAKCLLERVKQLRCYDYPKRTNDPVVFGYTADIEFRNYFVDGKTDQQGYVYLMAQIHYTLRDFHDSIDDKQKYNEIEYKLFGHSKMFDILCNVVMPTVSLHPYFEIYSHVNDWFLVAQRLAFTLRIADCLKYLCYIDLLLHRIELCEEKVNELEKLLCLTKFRELPLAENDRRKKYVYKRAPHEDEKPELEKKLFRVPDCFSPSMPSPCDCFVCTNLDYMYTLFACTYIRAQVYCFVDQEAESEQYFCAGSKLRHILNEWDSDECRKQGDYVWKRDRSYVVDYLMYLVDFGLCVAKFWPQKEHDALLLYEQAIDVAEENNLGKHPASVFATEMKFQHQVYGLDQEELFSAIYVPPVEKPDVEEKVEEKKGPVTRSKAAKLALERKMPEGPMTRSKAAELLKAQASTSKK